MEEIPSSLSRLLFRQLLRYINLEQIHSFSASLLLSTLLWLLGLEKTSDLAHLVLSISFQILLSLPQSMQPQIPLSMYQPVHPHQCLTQFRRTLTLALRYTRLPPSLNRTKPTLVP